MFRFSLKDILRGLTLASIGLGMLAFAFREQTPPTAKEVKLLQTLLCAFGGMLVGYGLAFPFKWPPHQQMLAMTGMFAAMSWKSGRITGLVVYVGLTAALACVTAIRCYRTRPADPVDPPATN
jgi:hypothetical protein